MRRQAAIGDRDLINNGTRMSHYSRIHWTKLVALAVRHDKLSVDTGVLSREALPVTLLLGMILLSQRPNVGDVVMLPRFSVRSSSCLRIPLACAKVSYLAAR